MSYDPVHGERGQVSTKTDYLAFSNNSYLNNNLLDLPSQTAVFAGNPASGACGSNGAIACTTYGYDEYGLGNPGVSMQHIAGETYPGNQTSVHRWLNTNNSSLVSYKYYNNTGTVYQAKDPLLNATSYTYSPGAPDYGAYLTKVTNALNQSTQYGYDSNTGLLTSKTDVNQKVTNYSYEALGRIHTVTYPASDTTGTGGGSETYTYDDSPPSLSVQVQHTIDASQSTNEYLLFDGLGRQTSQVKANGESTPYDRTDTCYDALGRKSHVSYPYQSNSTAAASCTSPPAGDSYTYDALSRITQLTHSDSKTVLTSYKGAATDVSDEGTSNPNVRVERVSQVDALGRMLSICEVTSTPQLGPGGTPGNCTGQDITNKTGFLTNYSYDALGNLLTVTQGTLAQRSFTYDSLSRLIKATNPESGTTCYGTYSGSTCVSGYDADGNLGFRTRPAPNQTSPTTRVTTTYQYDALNRLTQKLYSDGVTPPAQFKYDQSSITMGADQLSINNSVGRLSSTCTGASCAPTTGFSYDPMGRMAQRWQASPANGINFWVSYVYDYLGDETDRNLTGDDRASVYNVAGRLTKFTATNYTDATNPANLLTGAQYDAFGHMTANTLANGLSESWAYDARGRVTAMAVGTGCSLGNCSTNQYRYTVGYFANSNVTSSTDTVNGKWNYTYDDFNRLSTAISSNNGEGCSWDYDRYGNRWHQNPHSGSCPAPQYSFTGSNNRIDGASYDAVGNLLNDGVHSYKYDAENRINSVDNGATAYTYDAEDRRVGRTTGGAATDFIYDREGHVVFSSPPSPMYLEMYAAGLHLGTYIVNAGRTDSIFYYDHSDWLGTERARTDLSGTVCEKITSLPFGDNQATTSTCVDATDVSPLHFTGKERDRESGLDYFGARYDASSMGRFVSPDLDNDAGRPRADTLCRSPRPAIA